MKITIGQLRAFVAVIDDGGFGAAAGSLGITQSAVSHAVTMLERTLGGPVLTRHGRPAPTLFGEQVLGHARAAVAAIAAIRSIADQHDGQVAGSVRLAAPPTACQGVMPGLMTQWCAEFPQVDITIFEGDDDEVAGWLAGNMVDLAILIDSPAASGVIVGRDAFHALVRHDHPLAREEALDVGDLADDPFLLSVGGCERYIRELYRKARVPFTPTHRVREMATLLAMVRSGIGVSIVPGLASAMIDPALVLVPLRHRVTRTMILTGPADHAWHPAVSALVEAARTAADHEPFDHGSAPRQSAKRQTSQVGPDAGR